MTGAAAETRLPDAFPEAARIRQSLETAAERGGDLTSLVYARLFAAHPQTEPHFWRDQSGAIRGEMLARSFEAILDFISERTYAEVMIRNELITHEGYDVPRELFASFFAAIAGAVEEVHGAEWDAGTAAAWARLLSQLDAIAQGTPAVC